jgi:hypothetical protein
MEWLQRFEINPDILVSKPVVKGTRTAVNQVIEEIAFGSSIEIYSNTNPIKMERYLCLPQIYCKGCFKANYCYCLKISN